MDAIIDNVQSGIGGIYVCMNRQRAWDNARANFMYHRYDEIDNMSVEYLRMYVNNFCNGWHDLIIHEEEGMGLVCANG